MFGLSKRELQFGVIVSSSHFVQHFLSRLIPPLIPVLAVALTYPLWKLGLLISVYSLGSGLAQAPLGVASDRYDRVYILPTGIGIAGVGYLLFASAPTLGAPIPVIALPWLSLDGGFLIMLLGMLITGVGTAVTHPVGYPLISDNVSEDNKGKILGAFGSSSKFGDATSPAVVGGLIIVLGWDEILFLLGGLGIVYSVLLFWLLRDEKYDTVPASVREPENKDTEKDDNSEKSDSILQADKRTYLYPMLVIYFFFITKKFSSNGLQTFFAAFLVGVYAYSFEFMDISLGPESVANLYFTALFLFGAFSQLGFGGLTDRLEPRSVLIGCLAGATAGLLMLALFNLGPISLLLVLLLLGAGLWGLNPARDALISEISPPEREGRTFGYLWTTVQISGVIIPPFVGYLLDTLGYREGFLLLAVGTVLGAISIGLLFLDQIYVQEPKPGASPESLD